MSEAPAQRLWSGRFAGSTDAAMLAFGASLPVDRRLWRADIAASIAHARMLGAQGVIPSADAASIIEGLEGIRDDIESGRVANFDDLADEDIHMSVERELTRRIGAAGGRLHTGRSRNDQVATDTRLHFMEATAGFARRLNSLRAVIIGLAQEHLDAAMPGYTHLQKAQPVLFSQHLLAWQQMLARDCARALFARDAADCMPLGSAALAGTTYPLDRRMVADELGFSRISANSMDAVSDRDFLLDAVYAAAVCMSHLSRICEEIILWSTEEFGFIRLADAFSTGSSIMPQKKNPDFAELTRGKTGRVYGDLMALLTTLKALPLAYNKDLQEDKEGALDAIDTVCACLEAVEGMLGTMSVDASAMLRGAQGGFMAATDLADHLTGTGMPFREAHEVVGRLVLACEKEGRTLQSLTAQELQAFDGRFGPDAADAVDIEGVIARRTTPGGTARPRVAEQIDAAWAQLKADEAAL
jgi:argininosuccinate lyase